MVTFPPDRAWALSVPLPANVNVSFNPSRQDVILLFYGLRSAMVEVLDCNTPSINYTDTQGGNEVRFQVKSRDLVADFDGSITTTGQGDEPQVASGTVTDGNTSHGVTVTATASIAPSLTGLKIRFYVGKTQDDEKEDDTGIEVILSPAGSRPAPGEHPVDWFAGYKETRDFHTAGGDSSDPMKQPCQRYERGLPVDDKLFIARTITESDLAAVLVQIWLDPKPGNTHARVDRFGFGWSLVPQWNNVDVTDDKATHYPGYCTMGREPAEPRYFEAVLSVPWPSS